MNKIPKAMQKQIDALEPIFRKAFLDAVEDMTSDAQFALVVDALDRGDMVALYKALNIEQSFLSPLDDAIQAAYLMGGRDALSSLPVIPDPVGPGKLSPALRVVILGRKRG